MPREEIRIRTRKALRPAAAPVDPFVRPGPSQAVQLGQALSKFAETGVAVHLQSEVLRREEDKERALLSFQEHQRDAKTWSEIIKMDPSLETESPYFRWVMEAQMGEAAATRVGDAVADSLANGELSVMDSNFGDETGALVDRETPELAEQSESFRLGYAKSLEGELSQHRQTWRSQQRALHMQAANESFMAGVERVLWDDPENLSYHVDALIIRAMNGNMDPTRINRMVVEALRNVGKEKLDPSLLDLIDQLPTKGGYVGDIPSMNALRNKYKDEIGDEIERRKNIEWTQRGRDKVIEVEQALSEGYDLIMDNSRADVSHIERRLARGNNAAALQNFRNAVTVFQEGTTARDNPVVRRDLFAQIWDENDPLKLGDLQQQFGSHLLGEGDFLFLRGVLSERNEAVGADSPNKDTYKEFAKQAGELAEMRLPPGTTGVSSAGIDEVLHVNAKSRFLTWVAQNQQALDGMDAADRLTELDTKSREFGLIERSRASRVEDPELIYDETLSPLHVSQISRMAPYMDKEIFPVEHVATEIGAVRGYALQGYIGMNPTAAHKIISGLPAELHLWAGKKGEEYIADDPSLAEFPEIVADMVMMELYFALSAQETYHRTARTERSR